MTDIYDKTLKEYYGYDTFKPLQKEIIKNIIEDKKDVIAILATGYGKSICYQLPFLLNQEKSVIIISPLIALMEDQKYNLENKNIPVICFNSNLSNTIKDYEKNQLLSSPSNSKIIYMTPEYIISNETFIKELWSKNILSVIAIDEAHCVSSWGNDFRPDYKSLSCLKDWIPDLTIMALTATATPKVRLDIINTLKLKDYKEYVSSFNRSNLYIECKLKTEIKNDLEEYVLKYKDTFCIIYVRTREMTEIIEKSLTKLNQKSQIYHAGIDTKERQKIQQNFINGNIKWIVATVAFGMGIDQNINLVIHYGSPGDIESYYQEIGRAGRDNSQSSCIMFYDKSDMRINRILLKDIKDDIYRKFREKQIRYMEKYLKTCDCRRKNLLEYFGETFVSCINCDNCLKEKQNTDNIQKTIQYPIFLLLKFLIDSKCTFGITKIITILTGKKDSKIKMFYNNSLYGMGKLYDVEFWKYIINICIYNNLLKEETIKSGFGTIIKITSNTITWYNDFKNIKNINFEHFIFNNINCIYQIPNDCLNIINNIKTRHISGFEEIISSI
jgi:ATP-dependent DNA helicase RecQ